MRQAECSAGHLSARRTVTPQTTPTSARARTNMTLTPMLPFLSAARDTPRSGLTSPGYALPRISRGVRRWCAGEPAIIRRWECVCTLWTLAVFPRTAARPHPHHQISCDHHLPSTGRDCLLPRSYHRAACSSIPPRPPHRRRPRGRLPPRAGCPRPRRPMHPRPKYHAGLAELCSRRASRTHARAMPATK